MIAARTKALYVELERRGWSPLRLADELGVSPPTAQALLDGEPVSSKTVGAVLRVFAPLRFDDLFRAFASDAEEAAAK